MILTLGCQATQSQRHVLHQASKSENSLKKQQVITVKWQELAWLTIIHQWNVFFETFFGEDFSYKSVNNCCELTSYLAKNPGAPFQVFVLEDRKHVKHENMQTTENDSKHWDVCLDSSEKWVYNASKNYGP